MKTHDLHNEHGQLIGFRVGDLLLGQVGNAQIVRSLRGSNIVRKQKRFALSAPDDFCEFVVDGKTFLAVEPFGDNPEFWLLTEPPEECPQIEIVRQAFEKHGLLGRSRSAI